MCAKAFDALKEAVIIFLSHSVETLPSWIPEVEPFLKLSQQGVYKVKNVLHGYFEDADLCPDAFPGLRILGLLDLPLLVGALSSKPGFKSDEVGFYDAGSQRHQHGDGAEVLREPWHLD